MTGFLRSGVLPWSCQLWPDRWGHQVSTFSSKVVRLHHQKMVWSE